MLCLQVWLRHPATLVQLMLVSPRSLTLLPAMGKCFEQVSDRERKLIKEMAKEGLLWTQIQRITGRSSETINTVLHGKTASPGSGAPVQFSAKDLDKVLKVTEAMVKKANAQQEVTMGMILAKAGITVSQKTVREGLKENKYSFFKLKQKPLLEDADYGKRADWTTKRLSLIHI